MSDTSREMPNLQLGVDKAAAVAASRNALDNLCQALQKIIRVGCCCVAPVVSITATSSNVDAAAFGIHDGSALNMLKARVLPWDSRHKHITASLEAKNGILIGARFLELRTVGIVVECREVGDDVFPSAVVIHTPRGIKNPAV